MNERVVPMQRRHLGAQGSHLRLDGRQALLEHADVVAQLRDVAAHRPQVFEDEVFRLLGHEGRRQPPPFTFFVKAMNSSSFFRAAPLAIARRARAIPDSSDFATPET